MPSIPADAMGLPSDNEDPTQNQSPPSSCGSCASDDRQEELEHLGVADTVLAGDNWGWLRDLLDPVSDAAVRGQGKVYFARLLKTQDATGMDETLSEMETWREQLGDRREYELVRALFLLGYDKSLSLAN